MKCRIQIPSIVQTMIFSVLEISLRFFTLPLLSDVSCVNASKETSKSSAKHIRLPVLGLDTRACPKMSVNKNPMVAN